MVGPEESKPAGGDQYTLLIVDDDPLFLGLLEEVLAEESLTVITAADGAEAMALLDHHSVDVIVTDLQMPNLNGLELLREAKRRIPHILVIIVTGYASLETALEAIKGGAYDYVTKPFQTEEMKITVHNALDSVRLVRANERLLEELRAANEELERIRSRQQELSEEVKDLGGRMQKKQLELKEGMASLGAAYSAGMPFHLDRPRRLSRSREVSAELERLGRLRARAILSEEEFAECKRRLLGSMS